MRARKREKSRKQEHFFFRWNRAFALFSRKGVDENFKMARIFLAALKKANFDRTEVRQANSLLKRR